MQHHASLRCILNGLPGTAAVSECQLHALKHALDAKLVNANARRVQAASKDSQVNNANVQQVHVHTHGELQRTAHAHTPPCVAFYKCSIAGSLSHAPAGKGAMMDCLLLAATGVH